MPIQVRETAIDSIEVSTRMPFRYGIVTLTRVPHLLLRLRLEVDGRSQWGTAADHLPPKWFTKDPDAPIDGEIAQMRQVIGNAAAIAESIGPGANVFDLWQRIYQEQAAWAAGLGADYPPLLWAFGVSLVERAMIDAFCRAEKTPFARALRSGALGVRPGAIHPTLQDASVQSLLPPRPLPRLTVRHTVGLLDPLTEAEIAPADRLDDGLPQSLQGCIRAYGLRLFKLKIGGDIEQDILRLRRIAAVIEASPITGPGFTLDGNETYREVEGFRELWSRLGEDPVTRRLIDRVLFVEQPLHRAVALSDAAGAELSAWADRPPIIIDESDGELDSLPRALARGYAGTSHKNCKGVFKGVANAALIAQLNREAAGVGSAAGAPPFPGGRYLLSGEDLSNIGPVALLQDLAVAATLGIDHLERNGHHYFRGLSMFPRPLQERVLDHHGDLYHWHSCGFTALRIENGSLSARSVTEAPFGYADPDLLRPPQAPGRVEAPGGP